MPRQVKNVDRSFEMATKENIPMVDIFMLVDFVKGNPDFHSSETRGWKDQRAMRQCYSSEAVGYVQLKREPGRCHVKAELTPEHRIRSAGYVVHAEIEESSAEGNTILSCKCQDCPAAAGGCKHSLALLSWLIAKSSEPSVTEVECYWRKSRLASSLKEDVRASDFPPKQTPTQFSADNFRESYLQPYSEGTLACYSNPSKWLHPLSIHSLAVDFYKTPLHKSAESFMEYMSSCYTPAICASAERDTREQSSSNLWHELRYGRITASIAHQFSRCQTSDGSLVETIRGAYSVPENESMKRGKTLERVVLQTVTNKYQNCGMFLHGDYPILGASPDGIDELRVYEVKCPSTEKTVKNYLSASNKLSEKCMAQVQLQMLLANRDKALFCVADPKFEQNQKVTSVEVTVDKNYLGELVKKCVQSWEKFIYDTVMNFPRNL